MKLHKIFCALLAMLFLCVACASAPQQSAGAAQADPAELVEYRLSVGDRLRVSVYGEPDLSGDFVVGPNGSVSFPLLGQVKAESMTVPELSAALSEDLKRFVRQPSLNVEVTNYRPFFILGEVQSPGTYPFSVGLTVLNAVATAGGFSDRAAARYVYIRRSGQKEERLFPLTGDLVVQPGDTVRIPERRLY